MMVEAETKKHIVDVKEVHKLGNTVGGCTHPLFSIVTHGSRWVWISLYRLLPLPWKVPIVPHCHVSSRVTLLTVLLFIWGFHFLSVNFPT